MTKGKVVLVRFPFDDLSATKVRPAVCLTDPIGPHRHVIFAFITSQTSVDRLDTDVTLQPGHPAFAVTGLRIASTIRLHRLMTASTSLIRRELGTLSAATREEIARKLRKLFAL
jgi:mRNA interferase MazF